MAVELKPICYEILKFNIKGLSPLVMHKWAEKAKREMREKHAGRKTKSREKRDPEQEAQAATYVDENGRPGIPAIAFKSALIAAAHKDLGIEKTLVRKAVFTGCSDPQQILPISFKRADVVEDLVRVGAGSADLRYRPYFYDWSCEMHLEFEPSMIRVEDLVSLIDRAGAAVGICEWRPEKGGEYGRFQIDEKAGFKVTGKK